MFEQTFKNIDDILYKEAGADSELVFIEQNKVLDEESAEILNSIAAIL